MTTQPSGTTENENLPQDLIDSTFGNLGWDDSESYGLTWKVRGLCKDLSNLEIFDKYNVYGDILNSDIYGACRTWYIGKYVQGLLGLGLQPPTHGGVRLFSRECCFFCSCKTLFSSGYKPGSDRRVSNLRPQLGISSLSAKAVRLVSSTTELRE